MSRLSQTACPLLLFLGSVAAAEGQVWQPAVEIEPTVCSLEAYPDIAPISETALPLTTVGFFWFGDNLELPGHTYKAKETYLVIHFRPRLFRSRSYLLPREVAVNKREAIRIEQSDSGQPTVHFIVPVSKSVSEFLDATDSRNLDIAVTYADGRQSEVSVQFLDSEYGGIGLAMFDACVRASAG